MAQYQLHIAASLAACAAFSASVFALAKPVDNKVKLPEAVQDATAKDPFDVTKLEDVVNGEPIDEERFWSRVRDDQHRGMRGCSPWVCGRCACARCC